MNVAGTGLYITVLSVSNDVTDARVGISSGAARGEGEASPRYGVDVRKLCNMCVLSLSWNFFVSHDKYIARPSSKEPR